jgi:ankyrin repeat protein
VETLLKKDGLEVNMINTAAGKVAAIHLAVQGGHTEIVRRLIDCEKINLNAANSSGNTALHLAVQGGHTEIVRRLIDCEKINLNAANSSDNTALHLATFERQPNEEIVRLLINSKNAKLNAPNILGNTALHLAVAVSKGNIEIVKMLLDKGVKLDTKTDRNETALDIAKDLRHTEIVTLIENKTAGYVHILLPVRVAPVSH